MKHNLIYKFYALALTMLFYLAGQAADIYVSPDGTGVGTPMDPMGFQTALDQALMDGEDSYLHLAAGNYNGTYYYFHNMMGDGSNLFIDGGWYDDFAWQSEDPASYIDGQGAGRCLDIDGAEGPMGLAFDVHLSHLTIQNGATEFVNGAGVYFSSADNGNMHLFVDNCHFYDNIASDNGAGGHIYCNAHLDVYNSLFNNGVAGNGGGIFSGVIPMGGNTDVLIQNCQFVGNENYGNQGSTIWSNTDLVIKGTMFFGEPDETSSGPGSPIWSQSPGILTVDRCVFQDFSIFYWGSAIQGWDVNMAISNSLFWNNECGTNTGHGTIAWYHNSGPDRNVDVNGCTFVDNSDFNNGVGSAVHFRGNGNDWIRVQNCISDGNDDNSLFKESGVGYLEHTFVIGGFSGFQDDGGNIISGTPGFVSDSDFQLTETSVCRNAGNDNPLNDLDFYGGVRFLGSAVDMGCYEYNTPPTEIELQESNIDENEGENAYVGTLHTIEPEAGDIFYYEFAEGNGMNDADNDLFYFNYLEVWISEDCNHEVKDEYFIYLRSYDSYEQIVEWPIVITVNDVNEPMTLEESIPDQTGMVDEAFSYTLSSTLFSDPDEEDEYTYEAQLVGGNPLPSWLDFDAGTFTGTPDEEAIYDIEVYIYDLGNHEIMASFELSILPVGISEFESEIFKLYPNPVNDILNVESSAQERTAVSLYDMQGRLIEMLWLNPGINQIDVQHFDSGVYILRYGNSEVSRFTVK